MGVLSFILKHVSTPTELALPKRPRPIRDTVGDDFPEEWLQDRDASADETRVDLDDAPEESLSRDPRTVCSGKVSHRVRETDDGDDPVSNNEKNKCQRADNCHTLRKDRGGQGLIIHRANYEDDRDA